MSWEWVSKMGRRKKEQQEPIIKIDTEEVPKKKRAKRVHSEETKALISERRRSRTVQPRNISQSPKRKFFYDELVNDYGKIDKRLSDRKKSQMQSAIKWIEENKYNLGHVDDVNDFRMLENDYERWGILTEYKEMYCNQYETKIGTIIYSDELTPMNDNESDDPYMMLENMDLDFAEIFGTGDFDNE